MGVDLGALPETQRSREVRLGLVMYGGVSLAIYINGVAHEFFRAVHGNGVYKLLKTLIDSEIAVDIVSGTSAGGINGIFLGYALANGKDFGVMADLWRNHGDISRLLRDPERLDGQERYSVLNSEGYYHPRLEEAFELMDGTDYVGAGDDPSPLRELDLFVTGTDVDGNIYTLFDNSGHAIDVKDHRAVFQLKHRYGRRHPFAHDANDPNAARASYRALATLSRLTSCFPAAFASVEVKGAKWEQQNQPLDSDGTITARAHDVLREWGKLEHRRYFLDGGVLDNKPFTYTIREMVYRVKDREIERHLFYVEPDPERFDRQKQQQVTDAVEQPTVTRAAAAGAFMIPSYESLAADLQLLADYNASVIQYETICGSTAQVRETTVPYQVAPDMRDECCNRMYAMARQTQLAQRAVKGILRERGRDVMLSEDLRDSAERLAEAFRVHPSSEPDKTALEFDIYFRQRRLFHVTERLRKVVKEKRTPAAQELLAAMNRHIKLLEIFRFWMERLVDEADFGWQTVAARHGEKALSEALWDRVKRAFQVLLANDGEDAGVLPKADATSPAALDQDALSAIHRTLQARQKEIVATSANPESLGAPLRGSEYAGLLQEVDRLEQATLDAFATKFDEYRAIRRDYDYFIEIDACLFPIQLFSGVDEREIVRITRISPADAQRGFSERPLAEKVAGDDVAHFSGFFKRPWRSNDILWGRLDSCCQLIETLLTYKRMLELTPGHRASLGALTGMLPAAFPHATPSQFTPIETWLATLSSGAIPTTAEHESAMNRMIELEQIEILWEALPNVFEDAASQDDEWRQPTKDATLVTNDSKASAASMMAGLAQSSDVAEPDRTTIGRYFNNNYAVGSESVVADIPSVVRLDMAFTAGRVARSALLGTAGGSQGHTVRGGRLLRFLSTALDVFGRFFRTAREDKQLATITTAILLTMSIVMLLIGIVLWKDVLRESDGVFVLKRFALMIVAPLVILWTYAKLRLTRRVRLAILIALTVAAIVGAFAWKSHTRLHLTIGTEETALHKIAW